LELHCRQKGERVHVGTGSEGLVAGQQQESYKQLINKYGGRQLGQLVGDLWSVGGLLLHIPHGEEHPTPYAFDSARQRSILLKRVISRSYKFVFTNKMTVEPAKKIFSKSVSKR
jgi:hypothetical protein